jgi:glycosyltransferase involved in cell wall biosynthesis
LKNLSKTLRLEDNVNFFGFVEKDEDVYSYMKSSKIFVLPSTREGFPNTILEANSCGLPAIIVDHEKNAGVGVIKNNENGFIVKLSADEISNKILYLLKNESELNKLNKSSIAFAKNYDWELIVSKIEKVYEATLNET